MNPVADEAFVRGRTSVMSLRDGTRVKIRPVLPADKQRFLDGFARLSPASRYRRVEVDLPATTARLTGTPLYDVFRAVARGQGPAFLPPGGTAGG